MTGTLSEAELRTQFAHYQRLAHEIEAHNADTVTYLQALYARSRVEGDVWDELSAHRKAETSGVTGPLIKAAFRRFVGQLQGNRCCYCRRWLLNIAHAKPIEHILPRASYPHFSLYFWNLAVACFDCNQLKHDERWGAFPVVFAHYPKAVQFSEWYHPRFHRYTDHISFERRETNHVSNVTYIGHTPQGKHLCRELLYIVAARENLCRNNPSLAEAITTLQEFQEQHSEDDLPHLAAFRQSLNRSLQHQLDGSAVDSLTLKGTLPEKPIAKAKRRTKTATW
ncbi:hypothetical protein LZ023_22065 [Pseudomonas silvicola]|nr:hypothetical protein LZ023_22065 [Pseudomonas silvicola]